MIVTLKRYEGPLCNLCNSNMRQIEGRWGHFWGCQNYPDCRGTRTDNQCPVCDTYLVTDKGMYFCDECQDYVGDNQGGF